jgi:hypothetical protein
MCFFYNFDTFFCSTVSSGLNSLAAICLEDFVRPFCCTGMTDARATNVSKGLAMGFGLLCFGLVFVASQLGNVLEVDFKKYCYIIRNSISNFFFNS